ncbi:Hypothetical protein LCA_0304 [Latilactobacillus sakei subsp. sakei 23K]|uniref:Uncharacterized protein n=1 Tax=Latilactobacillus sakei subsp. sakei (strain 23K) TaxID=314315 RepID=Q38YX1_LATSS|nr:Hypothetical protein LCA_0304 [Latilactobacillus sakei subsp. sakei 23K]
MKIERPLIMKLCSTHLKMTQRVEPNID